MSSVPNGRSNPLQTLMEGIYNAYGSHSGTLLDDPSFDVECWLRDIRGKFLARDTKRTVYRETDMKSCAQFLISCLQYINITLYYTPNSQVQFVIRVVTIKLPQVV
jgi:hypothetical protein